MMTKISFRWVITLAMLAVGILPVLVLSFTLFKQAYDTSRSNALRELALMAGDGANRAEQEIRLLRSRLELLAQNSDMEFAVRSLAFVERADKLVRDFHRNNPLVHEIWYLNVRKEVVASAPIRVEMLAPPDDIESVIKTFFASDTTAHEVQTFSHCKTRDDQPAICFFKPVIGAMGDVIGIIAAQVRYGQLASVVLPSPSPTIKARFLDKKAQLIFETAGTEDKEEFLLSFQSDVALRATGQDDKGHRPLLFVLELNEPTKERFRFLDRMMLQLAMYILAVSVGVIGASLFIAQRLFRPIKSMTRLVSNYEQGAFKAQPDTVSFSEFQTFMQTLSNLGERIQFYMQRAAEDAARESALKRAVAEAELQTLKNQMKPHFLFNALNNVVALMSIDKERAQKLLLKLAELYRLILAQTEKVVIPLEDELAIVENFLALQAVRFENRLTYKVVCNVDRKRVNIPGLVLQTLVENALKHGIEPSREGGKVEVLITLAEKDAPLAYRAEVLNTGQPLSKKNKEGRGLENTRRRLTLIDGDSHGLAMETTAAGTLVTFFFSGRQYDQSTHC